MTLHRSKPIFLVTRDQLSQLSFCTGMRICLLYFLSTERLFPVNLGRYTAWCYRLCELIYILVILWTKDSVSLELPIILPYNVSISSSVSLPEPWGQVFDKNTSAPFHLWIYLLIIFYCKKTFSYCGFRYALLNGYSKCVFQLAL